MSFISICVSLSSLLGATTFFTPSISSNLASWNIHREYFKRCYNNYSMDVVLMYALLIGYLKVNIYNPDIPDSSAVLRQVNYPLVLELTLLRADLTVEWVRCVARGSIIYSLENRMELKSSQIEYPRLSNIDKRELWNLLCSVPCIIIILCIHIVKDVIH
jgi:hypothetical protein